MSLLPHTHNHYSHNHCPRNEVAQTVNNMHKLLHEFDMLMPSVFGNSGSVFQHGPSVRVVHEDDKELQLCVDLPGVDKAHVDLSYAGKTLKWSAHREDETQLENGAKTKSVVDFNGMRNLSFVPTGVKAVLDNGIMTIVVGKPETFENNLVKVKLE